jgi:hypothetical protein
VSFAQPGSEKKPKPRRTHRKVGSSMRVEGARQSGSNHNHRSAGENMLAKAYTDCRLERLPIAAMADDSGWSLVIHPLRL